MSLKQYLANSERLGVLSKMTECKLPEKSARVVAVLGNEAGDLDTFVSSCVLAWHLCWQAGVVAFPMLPFPKSDLPLKTEVLACFKQLDLSIDNFVFAGGDVQVDKIPVNFAYGLRCTSVMFYTY